MIHAVEDSVYDVERLRMMVVVVDFQYPLVLVLKQVVVGVVVHMDCCCWWW